MPARNPLFVWIAVSVFVASAASIPLAYRLLNRHADPPRTLTQLTELLSQTAPGLHVVPAVENRMERGIYICTQQQSREQLSCLVRNSAIFGTSRLGRWKGVVFCEKETPSFYHAEEDIRAWGEYGMRMGPLLFFGDPQLLRRNHKAIVDYQERKAVPE